MKLSVEFQDGKYDPEIIKNVILAVAPEALVVQFAQADTSLANVPLTAEELALGENATAIANVIINIPNSLSGMRTYILHLVQGGDTWAMSQGDPLLSPRPQAIAFSRYLKKSLPAIFPSHCKPPELLAEHARIYFKEGEYKGIEYRPTKLGRLVAEILVKKGFFK
ncbi:hypothetical protein N182_38000 [Sinorhizobium sp. GL2]|nr:hypothetical protein N182_38000 [Sinorhizobium sp. GL2]